MFDVQWQYTGSEELEATYKDMYIQILHVSNSGQPL